MAEPATRETPSSWRIPTARSVMAPLEALPVLPMVNLRGAGDVFLAAAERSLGMPLPLQANRFHAAGGRRAIWLGPDEWLVIGTADEADTLETRLGAALAESAAAVTDVTGNRLSFRLAGPAARDLIAGGCALDLHPRVFGPGHCAQTLLARTGVILLQHDDVPTFDLLVRRSFARYLIDWFDRIAATADIA